MATQNHFSRSRRKRAFLISMMLLVFILLPFQNCGGKFETYNSLEGALDSSSHGGYGFMPAKASGVRPLTLREYIGAVKLLIGDTSDTASRYLPEETFEPFDNAIETMGVSAAKIQGFEAAAKEMTTSFLANSTRMRAHLPCLPTGVSDRACFTNIVTQIGLKAFRRPLAADELTRFVDVIANFATKGGDYNAGLNVFFNVILQHPMFLYRWELGTTAENGSDIYRLNNYELASRLSFTLFGLPPDAQLLADAAAGRLTQPDSYKLIVDRMLNDSRALDHIDFFHAAWLGYQGMDGSTTLSKAMRNETKSLLKRVVIDEKRPWTDILNSRETFLNRELASHYGIPQPARDNEWVTYPDRTRGGILSHGTFLSVGAKFGDTSPVQRGYHIRKQLFCEKISPPPPGIDVDTPPMPDVVTSNCKISNHQASTLRANTSCVACHSRMDPIGFGLERFSSTGAYRMTEPLHPECFISGNGSAPPYGDFNGPAELGEVVLRSGRIESCMIERWMQLSYGVKEQSGQSQLTAKYLANFKRTHRLMDLLRAFVMDVDFAHRKTLESQ